MLHPRFLLRHDREVQVLLLLLLRAVLPDSLRVRNRGFAQLEPQSLQTWAN